MKKQRKISISTALLAVGLMSMSSVQADMVTWNFNLPATGLPSLNPPYPSIALLKLEDSTCGIVDCVKFTLDPNESNPGYNPGSAQSTIDRLNIFFSTTNSDEDDSQSLHELTSVSGPVPVNYLWQMPPPANDANMDAGYTSNQGQIQMDWNNPDFPVESISMWTILNTTIASNFSGVATGNNKPSPVFGIISVSPKIVVQDSNGDNVNPTPSNWVTGPSPVPVPAAIWLFGTALIGFIGVSRRTRV